MCCLNFFIFTGIIPVGKRSTYQSVQIVYCVTVIFYCTTIYWPRLFFSPLVLKHLQWSFDVCFTAQLMFLKTCAGLRKCLWSFLFPAWNDWFPLHVQKVTGLSYYSSRLIRGCLEVFLCDLFSCLLTIFFSSIRWFCLLEFFILMRLVLYTDVKALPIPRDRWIKYYYPGLSWDRNHAVCQYLERSYQERSDGRLLWWRDWVWKRMTNSTQLLFL